MFHLQLGPSDLARALLVPACREAGFDTYALGQPGKRYSDAYFLHWQDGASPELEEFNLQIGTAASVDELPREVLKRLEDRDEPILITATLRGTGVADRRGFVEEVLTRCHPAAETVVMACENDVPSVWCEIEQNAPPHVVFLRTIVNRVAIKYESPPDGRHAADVEQALAQGRPVIKTHRFGDWVIARPPKRLNLVDALTRAEVVRTTDHFDAEHDRKKWMVNGGHLAVAIMGRRYFRGAPSFRAVARQPGGLYLIGQLHRAMHEALAYRFAGVLGETLTYGASLISVYTQVDDEINRILKAYQRAALAPFVEALHERIFHAAAACASYAAANNLDPSRSGMLAPFNVLAIVAHELLTDTRNVLDRRELHTGEVSLTVAADAATVNAYRAMLESWMGSAEVERRANELERKLARDRRDYATTA